MIVFLQDFNYLLDTENESVYNIGIVNKREIIMKFDYVAANDLIEKLVEIKYRSATYHPNQNQNIYRNLLIWGEKTYDPKTTYTEIGHAYELSCTRVSQIVSSTDRFIRGALNEINRREKEKEIKFNIQTA